MGKYLLILVGFLFAMFFSGCGDSSTTNHSTVIPGVIPETIKSTEVPASNTFYVKQKDGTIITYTYDSSINSLPNASIILINNTDTKQYTFSRIQTETDYWLVFDRVSLTISRLYLASPPSTYDPTIMGGSIQGTALTLSSSPQTSVLGSSLGLSQPRGITYVKSDSCFYVADTAHSVIRKIDSSGSLVKIFYGSFLLPQDITNDGTNLYVADTGNHVIKRIAISTGTVTTIAGVSGSPGYIDSAYGVSAHFTTPSGITTDGTNLYVANQGNFAIRKIRLSGTNAVSTIAGSASSSKIVDGIYTSASFLLPAHLTTDGTYLYVVDYQNYGDSAIRKVAIATGIVTTIAGGNKTFTFGHLGGIMTDGTYLYMGYNDKDNVNTYIRRVSISSPGDVTDLLNIKSTVGYVPPYGLTTDGTSLFYTSTVNNNITQMK